MVNTEVKGESIQAAASEHPEEASAQESGSIRSAYLARVAAAASSDFGAHETAWESSAVRGAYLKHLAETVEVAAIGSTGGSEGNLLRTILAAHATIGAAPSLRRRARKARTRKR